jgi:hypothetical protein
MVREKNGIILGFILYFIGELTRAIEKLSKIRTRVLVNANISVDFTATLDEGS